jgi:hypothetical protein
MADGTTDLHKEEGYAAWQSRRKWLVLEHDGESLAVLALVEASDADEALRRGAAAVIGADGYLDDREAIPLYCELDDPPACRLCEYRPRCGPITPFCATCLKQITVLLNHAQLLPR